MRCAVVTGVSTGIGAATAAVLAEAGWQVFGSVRSEADAARARERFAGGFVPVLMDVTDETSVAAAAQAVEKKLGGRVLDGLVNNAGIALPGPLLAQSTEDFRRQVKVGLVGTLRVTKAFAPLLGARDGAPPGRGRIVNIGSTSGRLSLPFLGAYATVKHGMEGLSGSLRRELQLFGVDVVLVAPGAVATAMYDKAEKAPDALTGTVWEQPFRKFMTYALALGRGGDAPERVGHVVLEALTAPRPKTRYAPVMGKFTRWTIPTRLPARVLDRLIGKQFGLLGPGKSRR